MKSLTVLNKIFTAAIIFTMVNLNIAINIEQAKVNFTTAQVYAADQGSGGGDLKSGDGTFTLENTQADDSDSMKDKRQKMSGTYEKEEEDGFFSSSGMRAINVILLLGLSLIFTKIFVTFKPSRPLDLWAGAAGAAIYLWGEISAAMEGNKSLKDAKDKIQYEGLGEDGQVDISQKQMLEKEKEALETAKDAAESKYRFQSTAATMFGATAAYAGIIQAIQTSNFEACSVTCVSAAAAALNQARNDSTPGDSTVKFEVQTGNITVLTTNAGTCEMNPTQDGKACLAYIKSIYRNNGLKLPTAIAFNKGPFDFKGVPLILALMKILTNKAYASNASGIALIVGVVGGMLIPADKLIGTWIYSPGLRAWLWTAMSSLALMTSQDTKDQIEALEENIEKIDKILDKFKSAQSVTKTATMNQQKKSTLFSSYRPMEVGEEIPCIGGLPKIATNNGSKACPSAEKYLVKMNNDLNSAGFKMPSGLVGSLVDATNGTQGTSTITPKTQNAYANSGKEAKAINDRAKSILKSLVRNAKGPLKESMQKSMAMFDRDLARVAKKADKSGRGGLMASLPSMMDQVKKADDSEEINLDQKGLEAAVKGGNALDANTPKTDAFKFDFGSDADDAEAYVASKNSEFDANAQALAKMGTDENEGQIIEDQNVDIWKVISVRYKKTAYDRLLKRIE